MSPSRTLQSALTLLSVFALLAGCDVGTRVGVDAGGGGIDGNVDRVDTGVPVDTGPRVEIDPFDPANACGLSTIPTERVPGSLLIVFDKSGSMDAEVGSSTRYELAADGINNVLGGLSDELSAGLLMFPQSDCDVTPTPDVSVALLSTSRSQIQSTLNTNGPGGGTPAFAALEAGYDHLDTLTTPGQRGIVLVSDGGESCDGDEEAIIARVTNEHDTKGRLTFAVGLNFANNALSAIAFHGGTPRTPDCLPECTASECLADTDCDSGTCDLPDPIGVPGGPSIQPPGICGCRDNNDCVSPQTCEEPPAFCSLVCGLPGGICPPGCSGNSCQGDANCCHYNAADGNFQSEFEAALDEIARRLLESCVFDVPRGPTPSEFDPNQVNVGVTFDGEERQVLRRGSDGAVDSWNYTSGDNESLIIQGPICDRLLGGENAVVEIVLGCVTLI